MVQAHGLRPFDPYRALQLHPRAPRELVIEAYWSLVSRSRLTDVLSPEGAQQMQAISAAYALLMDDSRRRAYDAARGVRPNDHRAKIAGDHYATLCIDAEADARIVEVAYHLLVREEQRKKRNGQQLELDQAYRTLANPQLRAQYDASTAARREQERVVTLVDVSGLAVKPAQPPEHPLRRGIFGRRKARSDVASSDARDARLLTLSDRALDWDVAQPPAMDPQTGFATATAELVITAGPHAGRRVAIDTRTVSLGSSPDDDVMLGHDVSVRLAIWHHGDRYMLRHTGAESGELSIAGRPPSLAIVVLDDGDEIAAGIHRIRFRRFPDA